ncbi:phage regulatory protein, rha family [Halobacillus karajensis]|uniref:Rha family transcriptional regulator n=1 Tax=Halobacillus karajensis TaxID=195088 RepID=UPI0008A73EEC|nr:Rha family transcriptional regulator [Halobacillus karajensis]SEH77845.1 phage regulatory protein, rha family [Halobacillus karajensis]
MNQLNLVTYDGQLLVDSREVAEMTYKRHDHLVRDIDNYVKVIDQNPNLGTDDFFIENNYRAGTGRLYKHYLLTRKGCDMVANKMTGEKGVLFTAEYVTRFEEMESNQPRVLSDKEQLMASMKLSLETSEEIGEIKEKVSTLESRFENELTLKHAQAQALQHSIKKRVEQLFVDGVMGVLESKKQMYSRIHSQLRKAFQTPTYREIKRDDFDEAMQWVNAWRPL